ncbi:hypothetical protein FS837_012579 [Tulasnella sp. UAMH 9824]|nr:hypothetical protein FS837_012579 [Tulasnella sp. UAMH 9824]
MSDLKDQDFPSSDVIANLGAAFDALSEKEKKSEVNKSKAIFELLIKNKDGKEQSWVIDLKKEGKVVKGKPQGVKPDVTLIMDETFTDLASGKIGGQKAYMTGKLKTRGNMMLATKLEGVLKLGQPKQQKARL